MCIGCGEKKKQQKVHVSSGGTRSADRSRNKQFNPADSGLVWLVRNADKIINKSHQTAVATAASVLVWTMSATGGMNAATTDSTSWSIISVD